MEMLYDISRGIEYVWNFRCKHAAIRPQWDRVHGSLLTLTLLGFVRRGNGSSWLYYFTGLKVSFHGAGIVAIFNAGILYEHQLESRLLYFQPNCLLMCLRKAARDGQSVWALLPTWETRAVSGSCFGLSQPLQPSGE